MPSILMTASSVRLFDSNLLTGKVIGVVMPLPANASWKVPLLVFPVTAQLWVVGSLPKAGALTTLAISRPLLIAQVSLTGRPASGLLGLGVNVTVCALS